VLPISAAASCECSPRRSPSLAGCGPRAAAVLDDAAGDGLSEENPGPARGRSRRTGRRARGTAWDEESGCVDQQGRVGVLVASCRRPLACGPRSWPSFQAFPPSSCAWAALLVHRSKPGRPARLAHRQIRYLLESVGSGETWCAKANIDNDLARRGGCRSLRPGRVTQARRPVDLADDFGSSVTAMASCGRFLSFFLGRLGPDQRHHDDGALPTAVRCGYLPGVPE
jgi:hypothetical protein